MILLLKKWNRYLNPDLLPNHFNLKAINLYLRNLKKDNPFHDLDKHLKTTQELLEVNIIWFYLNISVFKICKLIYFN